MLPLRSALRLSLLAAALVAANLVHADVPAGAPFTPEQQLVLEKYQSGLADKAEDVASKLDELEARLQSKQEYDKDVLALGQKNIDWMLGFLGLTLAAAAFLGWRTKARIESEWAAQKLEIEKEHQRAVADTDKAREALTREVGRSLEEARERLRELREELKHARNMNTEIRQIRDSANTPRANAPAEEIDAAQKENEANAEHSPQSKLAALAQKLGKERNWQEAATRWQALTDLEPDNADYWFNYSYALHHWMQQSNELAQIHDLARRTQAAWKQVIAKRSNDGVAYFNLGAVLLEWAHTLGGSERETKLQEAESVLLQAQEHGHPSLYNLICLRALQNRPDEARELLQQTRTAGDLPDYAHLRDDKTLESLHKLDWFKDFLEDLREQEAVKATLPA